MSNAMKRAPTASRLADLAKSLPLYPLPHHAISRLVHAATRWRLPVWKNLLIDTFIRAFGVDMSQAAQPDAHAYEHFNQFFTRPLKPGARPLPQAPGAIACPADGTISAVGSIEHDRLLQAKGHHFTVAELLGGDPELAERFHGGRFITVYLSPRDYHRIHMPADGLLEAMIHIPGRLFSVAAHTVRTIPRLFARNERVASIFLGEHGPMAVVLVGAINVGSVETVWSGVVTPPAGKQIKRWSYAAPEAIRLARGDELGRFNMGSTAIVLFGAGQVEWDARLAPEQKVQMGQELGRYVL
jgi:phosphatidylserine decarboxylase